MDDEFKDLQRLLRLKRYEAPPPDYFEDFLVDFHRRQRAELLKRPLWRLMLDRVEGAIPTFSPTRYAYAGACATAVAATVLASSHILASGGASMHRPDGVAVAKVQQPATRFVSAKSPRINIYSNKGKVRISPELDFEHARPVAASTVSYTSLRPRSVLDTQPVSYERPYSF